MSAKTFRALLSFQCLRRGNTRGVSAGFGGLGISILRLRSQQRRSSRRYSSAQYPLHEPRSSNALVRDRDEGMTDRKTWEPRVAALRASGESAQKFAMASPSRSRRETSTPLGSRSTRSAVRNGRPSRAGQFLPWRSHPTAASSRSPAARRSCCVEPSPGVGWVASESGRCRWASPRTAQ